MGSWPIIARPDHVHRLVIALGGRPARAQLLRGPSGVGKTTVAAAASAALAADGRTIVPVVALEELRDVPLGALAPILGSSRFAPHDDVGQRLHELVALVGSHADSYLLVVDDAPLLDDVSAAALYQLVRVFGVPALLTARDEHPLTGALARLLHEDLVTVTDLPGLELDQVREVLRRRLGGDPRPETLRMIVERTRGNPLFVRELVLAAERSGRIRRSDYGVEVDPTRLPEHIIGTVAGRLATLRDDERAIAELLAVAQPWPPLATRNDERETVDGLVSAGIVVASGPEDSGYLQLAHPVFAEALLAALSPQRRAALRADAARRLLALDSAPLRFTALCLLSDSGAEVTAADLAWAAGYAHAVGDHARAIVAADQALSAYDSAYDSAHNNAHTSAHDSAHATAEADTSAAALRPDPRIAVAAHLARAAALSALGRVEEADSAFAQADSIAEPGNRALVHLRWGQHTALRRHDPRAAIDRMTSIRDTLDDAGAALIGPDLAKWRLMVGDTEALSVALAPVRAEDGPAGLTAALGAAMMATMSGRVDDASAAIDAGRPLAARFADIVPFGGSLLDLSTFLVVVARGRIGEARSFAEERRLDPFAESAGIWSYALALIHLHGGRLHDAAPLAALAVEQLRWRDFTGLLGPALALAATVHAQLGDRSSAQALLDALAPAHRDDIKVRLQSAEAQAWLAVGQGDSQEAVEVLAATVRQGVEAGHGLLASLTATVALRLDGAEQVVDTLRAAADVSGSRLTALILSAAEMQIARDARGVVDHAPELTAAGLGALAHELVSRVPGWAPDDRMLVRRARVYANELALTVSSPLSVPGIRDDVGLTEREWMVATAAARRERSREIAERLGVSVRTVDNHLSNIYRKLGVRSRSELEQELREIL